MNQPLVSVVIPVYNRQHTVVECIQSILNQTYQNFEIIAVDDISTDLTADVIMSMSNPRIKYVSLESKGGAQVARNKGILEATADWIAFLDSDDLWEPNKLEMQINKLKEVNYNPYTVIHCDCYCFDVATNKKWMWNLPVTKDDCYSVLLSRPAPMFQGILTSKRALSDIGLLDEKVVSYQEWDTSIMLARICSFVHIRQPLFTYVYHKGETISKNKVKDIEGYCSIVMKYKTDIDKLGLGNTHWLQLIFKSLNYKIYDDVPNFISQLDVPRWCIAILTFFYNNKLKINKPFRFILSKLIK